MIEIGINTVEFDLVFPKYFCVTFFSHITSGSFEIMTG